MDLRQWRSLRQHLYAEGLPYADQRTLGESSYGGRWSLYLGCHAHGPCEAPCSHGEVNEWADPELLSDALLWSSYDEEGYGRCTYDPGK